LQTANPTLKSLPSLGRLSSTLEIEMAKRYYFHGDEIEGKLGQFYCAYCDLLVSENHFSDTQHSGSDKERYDRSVKGWKVLRENSAGRFQRPNGASNLFSSLPNPKKHKTGPFYRWLVKQQDRDDPIGDLSKDVQRDKRFPLETSSLEELRNHLLANFFVCSETVQALDEAYKEFKSNKSVRSGLSLSIRFEVFRRDDYRCQICGASASEGARLEVDHKIPVAKEGADEMSNLWALCFECNRGKGTKNL